MQITIDFDNVLEHHTIDIKGNDNLLFDTQIEDVHSILKRFETGKGYLITNGTGTGKTFVGLGTIKKFYNQNKRDIFIIVPTEKKCKDWIDEGKLFGLNIHQIENIHDPGKEISVTTYANFYQNQAILRRNRHLLVYDEAHYLNQNAQGYSTSYFEQHRELANLPSVVKRKVKNFHSVYYIDENGNEKWYLWERKYKNKSYRDAEEKDPFNCKCPGCKNSIEISRFYNNGEHVSEYYQVVTSVDDFQVYRIFHVRKNMKKREKASIWCNEIIQHWIGPNGSYTTMAVMGSGGYGYYGPSWSGELSIKDSKLNEDRYAIEPYKTYPIQKFSSVLKKSNFDGNTFGIRDFRFTSAWLSSPILETLIKTNRHDLIKTFIDHRKEFIKYWNSIKICWRNKYKISDFDIWLDYVELLRFFNKDIHSPKFICPVNLKKEHDKYVLKKREVQRKIDTEKTRLRMIKDQVKYENEKGKFFGLVFIKDNITIEPMKTVQQVMEEADLLKHCAFTNEYHNKKNSLLLSARVNDEIVETIEIIISSMKINQARGLRNNPSQYNKDIVALVNKNIPQIKKCLSKSKKRDLHAA